MDLKDLRDEINKVDDELSRLFSQRMLLSEKVAALKTDTDQPVYNEERENEIIKNAEKRFDKSIAGKGASLYSSIMLLSREYQYEYMIENGKSPKIIERFLNKDVYEEKRVCYYGSECSWSNLAAMKMCPDAEFSGSPDFDTVFEKVASGEADAGILPLDNSTAGTVREVYDLLLKNNLFISATCLLDIEYSLAGSKNTSKDTVKTVFSHPQSLSQCRNYLSENGFIPKEYFNTAAAAKFVSESGDNTTAALCNMYAAEKYGLEIIDDKIRDSALNTTRFIKVTGKPLVTVKSDIISIAFNLKNKSGVLAALLAVFKDYGVNLMKIESRPIPEKPFEYLFYLDFAGNIMDEKTKSILLLLESELPEIYLLGNYSII
ncbi:MAG: prephenate dehydratase domain-containing protein [Bacillota bacterium]|nr:prephenate dehydratase domain-containing protein [Bacillota bacterium]